jgi:hypothetical protein
MSAFRVPKCVPNSAFLSASQRMWALVIQLREAETTRCLQTRNEGVRVRVPASAWLRSSCGNLSFADHNRRGLRAGRSLPRTEPVRSQDATPSRVDPKHRGIERHREAASRRPIQVRRHEGRRALEGTGQRGRRKTPGRHQSRALHACLRRPDPPSDAEPPRRVPPRARCRGLRAAAALRRVHPGLYGDPPLP